MASKRIFIVIYGWGDKFFDDDMRIGASKPEAVDAGTAWDTLLNHWPELWACQYLKIGVKRLYGRMELVEKEVGWNDAMLNCERSFEKTSQPYSALGITDHSLHRANIERIASFRKMKKSFTDSFSFLQRTKSKIWSSVVL